MDSVCPSSHFSLPPCPYFSLSPPPPSSLSPDLNSSRQVLYIADDNEIRSLDPAMPNWRYEQTFQGDANVRIDAMDLHVKTNRIYWTNWHTGRISSYELPSSSSSSSGPSSNTNRNRRQSEGSVTTLEVRPDASRNEFTHTNMGTIITSYV